MLCKCKYTSSPSLPSAFPLLCLKEDVLGLVRISFLPCPPSTAEDEDHFKVKEEVEKKSKEKGKKGRAINFNET